MTTTVEQASPIADRLLRGSARLSYDPEVDLDWDADPVPGKWWMQPERMSLYGTALWDRLSEEQRMELSRHEIASIMSVGLWFEVVLMQVLLRDVYVQDARQARTHYALTEIADECRHSTMFGKLLAVQGMPAYGPLPRVRRLGRLHPLLGTGATAFAATLIGEEPADRFQRAMIDDDRIQPLVRMVSRIHVTEEARHVSFARDEVRRTAARLTPTKRRIAQALIAESAFVMMRSLVRPEVYAAVGVDPAEGRRTALGNPHYRATIAWMGEKVMPFLAEQGLVAESGRVRKLWRASFLLP